MLKKSCFTASKSVIMTSVFLATFFTGSAFSAPLPQQAKLDFVFELPKIETTMYARPYVAIWVEDSQRKPVKTIQLWVGKDEWLKDYEVGGEKLDACESLSMLSHPPLARQASPGFMGWH